MQPTLCSRCKKNVAVIFITRIENGESHNEGLCLRCARELHIKPVDEMMEKLGISDADLDNLTGDVAEMLGSMGMLGGDGAADADADASDADTDEDDGKTATFPFLNRLFNQNPPPAQDAHAAYEYDSGTNRMKPFDHMRILRGLCAVGEERHIYHAQSREPTETRTSNLAQVH